MMMMSSDWVRLQTRLSREDLKSAKLLVGLDFDGTLAEIVESPEKAALSPETRRSLTALSRRPDTKVAILSGRSLGDVKRMVGLSGLYYCGSHGLEIEGPGIRWVHPQAGGVGRSILRGLESDLREFPGAFVERKRLGAAVHYRRVPRSALRRLRDRVRVRLAGLGDRLRFIHGKMTFDLRPDLHWNKGHALGAIRKRLPGGWRAVFVGDDATDEEAFRTLGARALTVRIGRVNASAAQFIIPRRRLVDRLLKALAKRRGTGVAIERRVS